MSRLAPSFLPATAVLEMTYRCNHNCIFCSCPWMASHGQFDRRPELSTDKWKEIITQLCNMGVCNLAFTGGEPLLKQDIFDIIHFAAQQQTEHIETIDDELKSEFKAPNIYLISNGLKVDDDVLRFCKDNNVQLSMSLPGLETFEEHTGVDNADHVLEQFRKAKEFGLDTVVNITVTKRNLPELRENIAAAFLAGADQLLLNRFLPGGQGLKYAESHQLDCNDLTQMFDTVEDVLQKAARFGSLGTEVPKCVVEADKYERLSIGTRCSAAIDFFVIDPSGYVRVCNHSEKRLNHFDDIEKLKMNDYWLKFTQKRYLPEMCDDCSQIHDCDGGCREAANIVGGCLDAPDMLLNNVES